jgi:hypothetical protein
VSIDVPSFHASVSIFKAVLLSRFAHRKGGMGAHFPSSLIRRRRFGKTLSDAQVFAA